MTYEQFIEQVKWEVEDIARESFDDVRTVVRTVTKNNNVRRKTISIFKEGQLATPTIYLRDYYLDYKKGRSIENIGREIFGWIAILTVIILSQIISFLIFRK